MTEKNVIIINKLPTEKCMENFKKYIIGSDFKSPQNSFINKYKEDLLSLGIKGNLSSIYLRPMIYKIFLNHLPIDKNLQQWISITFNNRVSYLHLKSKYFPLQTKNKNTIIKYSNKTNINSNENKNNNTLIDDENDEEIKNIIDLDLSRTLQDISLFKDSKILKILFNVLYIYYKEHLNTTSYKQGMNEIIAILFLSIYPYYFPCKKNITKIDIVNALNIYNKKSKLFLHKSNQNNVSNYNIKKNISHLGNNIPGLEILFNYFHDDKFLEVDLYYLFNDLMDKGFNIFFKEDTFQKRCDNIINNKLKIIDFDLYKHCTNINLAYQIFIGKWIQTFFDQLTNMDNCISILDIIISQEYLKNNLNNEINVIKKNDINKFEYLDCICLSMIKKYRDELLKKNGDEFLIFCLCYPEINNFDEIIQSANYINHTIKIKNLDINKDNENLDKKSTLNTTPKKKINSGKLKKNHLSIKTNKLCFSEINVKLYKTKKLFKKNTVIDSKDKNKFNTNNTIAITSPSNNCIELDKMNKSSNCLDIKTKSLRNKKNFKNDEEKNKNKGIGGSFLRLFDNFNFTDLIDTYYF